ncbi:MAG: MBL fold metallo-hydrolase [Candidatus Wallbacteria bacterium]
MRFKFWGVRGSIPTPGKSTVRYGGNTSCVELFFEDRNQVIILDAGTGIRELGNELMTRVKPGTLSCNIFLSHTHWDHVQGFPFFTPAFIPGNKFSIYGPPTLSINEVNSKNNQTRLKDLFVEQMRYQYFPVKLDEMRAETQFIEIKENVYNIDGITIRTKTLNHPILCLGYRFCLGSAGDLTYCTDTEPFVNYFFSNNNNSLPQDMFSVETYEALKKTIVDPINTEKLNLAMQESMNIIDFCKDSRALIFDAQYTKDEYTKKMGWGHSRIDDAVSVACRANVETLYLFHHEPTRSDSAIDDMLAYARELAASRFNKKDLKIVAATEDCAYNL